MELQHEPFATLANVKGIELAAWDSLGELILLGILVGPADGPSVRVPFPVHMTPEVAQEVVRELQRVLAEKPDAGGSRQ